ncbi:MAG: DUF4040 domain-containing protein [Spirochaetaceae bacterium]|nr:DUF4040 domain-containing protein [Spirochaetaceae bacterium]
MMFSTILMISLALLVTATALMAVQTKSIVTAIISAGIVSLLASVGYLVLAAPDVAMTEAAIGSGLTTIIFFYVLNKVRRSHRD